MRTFHYQNKNEPHGIIKALHYKYGTNASKYISVYANSILKTFYPINIFNFAATQWVSNTSVADPYVKFCFLHHKVKLEGYQFHPNTGDCRFKSWTMYATSTPDIFEESKNADKSLSKGEIAYFETDFSFHQCFKIKHRGVSNCGTYQADIQWLEMYGTIKNLGAITCQKSRGVINSIVTYIILVTVK